MRSPRRQRLLYLAVFATAAILFFYTDPFHQDFYHKTVEAMDRPRAPLQQAPPPPEGIFDYKGGETGPLPIEEHIRADINTLPADRDADGDVDADDKRLADDLKARLEEAAKEAKKSAALKVLKPDAPAKVVGVGNAAAGQTKEDLAKAAMAAAPAAAAAPAVKEEDDKNDKKKETTQVEEKTTEAVKSEEKEIKQPAAEAQAPVLSEKEQAEQAVDQAMKEAPVVIFSKTYCRFSKAAKALLLDKYFLTPPPHVVELDEHPLGGLIQDVLEARTGRHTVPNVMVKGTSIGGADDVAALDKSGQLIAKVEDLAKLEIKITERL